MPHQSKVIYEEVRGGSRTEMRIDAWEKQQELRAGKYTVWDHCFELPGKKLEAEKTIVDAVTVGAVTHKLKVGSNGQLEVYEYPANRYVAGFVGNINLIEGRVTGRANGRVTLRADALDAELAVACDDVSGLDGEVSVAVRPEKVTISREAPSGAAPGVNDVRTVASGVKTKSRFVDLPSRTVTSMPGSGLTARYP